MLKLGILSVVLLSATAMAEPSYMAECRAAAIKKLSAQAQAKGAHLQSRSVKVVEIDDRWYNPSKYVWFAGEATDGKNSFTLQTMTQKSFLPPSPCF